jgi:transcriptional regulator with XRE-family HTH domain
MVRRIKDGFANAIRAARTERKLTQEQLAEQVNLSLRYITFLENENKKPSFTTLYKLIRFFGIDANTIFYPENDAEDTPVKRLSRLLLQCDEREIKALTAHVETLISEKK